MLLLVGEFRPRSREITRVRRAGCASFVAGVRRFQDGLASLPGYNPRLVKVLALDYGPARTGVAVSDPTGTLARPLEVVEKAATETGIGRILDLCRREEADRIVVGLPVTLRGERGAQAAETERFVETLRTAAAVPVEVYDERFTTRLARSRGARAPVDAVAAAELLTSYLTWTTSRHA